MTQQFFPVASGSSFSAKRKNFEEESEQQQGVRSPPLKRRATFAVPEQAPVPGPDQDMSMDEDPVPDASAGDPNSDYDNRGFVPHYDYEYGMSGSGGMGFGPGAEEDGDLSEETMGVSHSPISVQPYTTTLAAPNSTSTVNGAGVFQPASCTPLPFGASDIERARNAHGPQCKSIPKLVISPYADQATGKQAMYTMCPDCGSCERAA